MTDFLFILALIAANAFLAAAELALVGVRRSRVQTLAKEGNRAAALLQKILAGLEDYIFAIQVGMTICSLALGWFGEEALARFFSGHLSRLLPGVLSEKALGGLSFGLSFAAITTGLIVLGEMTPKALALQSAERFALAFARPVDLLFQVLRPFVWILRRLTGAVTHILRAGGPAPTGHHVIYTEEELKVILESSKKQGVLEPSEEELIRSVFEFTDTTVEEVMRPKPDMEMVPEDVSTNRLLHLMADTGRSRYPVHRKGDEDQIIGIVHVKDVLEQTLVGDEGIAFDVRAVMRRPLFVPENRRLPDLLATLRRENTHMAIVITEFGNVAGLVTLEDIVEELVGEIHDEFDEPEKRFEQVSENLIVVNGMVPIGEFNERLGVNLPREDYGTVGGYLFGRLGRPPRVGDEIREEGLILRVQAVDGFRVTRIACQKRASAPVSGV